MHRGHHFIGISIPDHIKQELFHLQRELQVSKYYKKITGKQDFHITLLFLGGWDHGGKVKLWERLHQTLVKIPPINLKLKNIGFFGKETSPRVLWTSLLYDESLLTLQQQILEVAATYGFPLETRPFRPHITLGKTYKSKELFTMIPVDVPQLNWDVEGIDLFLINPGKSPMYESISKISLSR